MTVSKPSATLLLILSPSVKLPSRTLRWVGCGHRNKFKFSNDTTSGIVGIGYSNVSIIKQLRKEIGGKFAHCLSHQSDSKSYISLGTDAIVKGMAVARIQSYVFDSMKSELMKHIQETPIDDPQVKVITKRTCGIRIITYPLSKGFMLILNLEESLTPR
nr:aspartic proteinase CDR1-like [Ipomoea batatas]